MGRWEGDMLLLRGNDLGARLLLLRTRLLLRMRPLLLQVLLHHCRRDK